MRPMCMNTWKATVSHIAKRGILNQQQLAWQKLSDLDKQNFIFLKGPQSFLRKGLWLWTEIWLQNLVSPCKWQFLGTTHRDLLALHFMVAFLEYLCSKPPPPFLYIFLWLSLSSDGLEKRLDCCSLPSFCLTVWLRVTPFTGFYIQIKGYLEFILKVHVEHRADMRK